MLIIPYLKNKSVRGNVKQVINVVASDFPYLAENFKKKHFSETRKVEHKFE